MGAHRGPPWIFGLLEPLEPLALAHSPRGWIRLLTASRRHLRLPRRRFFGIDEASTRCSLLPSSRRRGWSALERSQQLFEILARYSPDLPDPDAAEHALLDPGSDRLGRHLEPLGDLANCQELGLLGCAVGHGSDAKYGYFALFEC